MNGHKENGNFHPHNSKPGINSGSINSSTELNSGFLQRGSGKKLQHESREIPVSDIIKPVKKDEFEYWDIFDDIANKDNNDGTTSQYITQGDSSNYHSEKNGWTPVENRIDIDDTIIFEDDVTKERFAVPYTYAFTENNAERDAVCERCNTMDLPCGCGIKDGTWYKEAIEELEPKQHETPEQTYNRVEPIIARLSRVSEIEKNEGASLYLSELLHDLEEPDDDDERYDDSAKFENYQTDVENFLDEMKKPGVHKIG